MSLRFDSSYNNGNVQIQMIEVILNLNLAICKAYIHTFMLFVRNKGKSTIILTAIIIHNT